jgi:hypothetical protein
MNNNIGGSPYMLSPCFVLIFDLIIGLRVISSEYKNAFLSTYTIFNQESLGMPINLTNGRPISLSIEEKKT